MLIVDVLFLLILFMNRRRLGVLKNKYTYLLSFATILWWLFLVVSMLRTNLVCTPDDALCNSGNTFWGDVTWGTGIAFVSSALIWIPYVTITFIVSSKKKV